MSSTDPCARKWFRHVRFRLALIYMLSVAVLSGAVFLAVYAVEWHTAQSHICQDDAETLLYTYHISQIGWMFFWSWLALVVLSAGIGILFAPFITQAAEEAMENLSRSADAIAHDLRTPLTRLSVRSEMELLKNGPTADFAAEVASDARGMITLVNTLLEIARMERDGRSDTAESVNLCEVVRDTADLFAPSADDLGVSLGVRVPNAPIRFPCHHGRISQVVGNLVDNALKHTPSGGAVTISLMQKGPHIRLCVADTGSGIDPTDIPHVFEKFYRGKRNRSANGNGLGLALVHAIVTSYGGSIDIDSALGRGSVFTVSLGA